MIITVTFVYLPCDLTLHFKYNKFNVFHYFWQSFSKWSTDPRTWIQEGGTIKAVRLILSFFIYVSSYCSGANAINAEKMVLSGSGKTWTVMWIIANGFVMDVFLRNFLD